MTLSLMQFSLHSCKLNPAIMLITIRKSTAAQSIGDPHREETQV